MLYRSTPSRRLNRAVLVPVVALLTLLPLQPVASSNPPEPPVIENPQEQNVAPGDVHMEIADPFRDPDGDAHAATDWEIRTADGVEVVWAAYESAELLHAHLSDGVFQGPLAGESQLRFSEPYLFRVRFQDSRGDWSRWSQLLFITLDRLDIPFQRVAGLHAWPAPRWVNDGGGSVDLPVGAWLALDAEGATLLAIANDGDGLIATPGASLPTPGPLRLRLVAPPGAELRLPSSRLAVTTDAGVRLDLHLPALTLPAGGEQILWVTETGATFYGQPGQTHPARDWLARDVDLPWRLPPGYRLEAISAGFRLPTSLAFVEHPGSDPAGPRFYVTELYHGVKVVTNDGRVFTLADDLLNYQPNEHFAGSGELGVIGVCLPPDGGGVYVTTSYRDDRNALRNRVLRIRTADGITADGVDEILVVRAGGLARSSHQVQQCSFGPDGKLYVFMADGPNPDNAQDNRYFSGKVLRLNPDGSAPPDNPKYDPADPTEPISYQWTKGHRNAFGMAWRQADGQLYLSENGPSVDRLVRATPGVNYGWNGTDESMRTNALYVWPEPRWSPVGLAFAEGDAAGAVDSARQGRLFVGAAGPVYAKGPQAAGKAIQEFAVDPDGSIADAPSVFARYVGEGRGSIADLKARPDGLYFTDLYLDDGDGGPTAPGGKVWRIRYDGQVDASPASSGPAPAADSVRLPTVVTPVVAFPATGVALGGDFKRYWEAHGGLTTFGYPITGEFRETNPADGREHIVQYFERARFEYYPEHAGTDDETQLGPLGRQLAAGRLDEPAFRPLDADDAAPGGRFFPETGHSLTGAFRSRWEATGGAAIHGLPISEPFEATSPPDPQPYLVQYFERGRMELHVATDDAPGGVRLARVGLAVYAERPAARPVVVVAAP